MKKINELFAKKNSHGPCCPFPLLCHWESLNSLIFLKLIQRLLVIHAHGFGLFGGLIVKNIEFCMYKTHGHNYNIKNLCDSLDNNHIKFTIEIGLIEKPYLHEKQDI